MVLKPIYQRATGQQDGNWQSKKTSNLYLTIAILNNQQNWRVNRRHMSIKRSEAEAMFVCAINKMP